MKKRQMAGFCELGNEPSLFTKELNFFTKKANINFSGRNLFHGVR
jgi:hypothetical protein